MTKLKETEETYRKVNEDYINAPFITNHDMSRVCNALNSNEDDIKFAGGLLLSMGGSPFIYYGEELGMKSKGKKDENKRLRAICSVLPTILRHKGSIQALVLAINALLAAEGVSQPLDYTVNPKQGITLYVAQELTDLSLFTETASMFLSAEKKAIYLSCVLMA